MEETNKLKFELTNEGTLVAFGLDLRGADLKKIKVPKGTQFIQCNFDSADLSRAEFKDVTFSLCSMKNVKMKRGILTSSAFESCDLSGISLDGVALNDTRFITTRIIQAKIANLPLTDTTFEMCNLSFTEFEGVNLSDATFNMNRMITTWIMDSETISTHLTRNELGIQVTNLEGAESFSNMVVE